MEYVWNMTGDIDEIMEYEWDCDLNFVDLYGLDDLAYSPNGKSAANGESMKGICVV